MKKLIPLLTGAIMLLSLAGTGDWQEGQRFPSAVTQQEVTDWVKSLGK